MSRRWRDVFSAGGYRTGLFGKWHLGDSYPYLPQNRGFQEVVHHKSWGITSAADYWGNDYFDDTYSHNGKPQKYEGYCNDVWFREAMNWMKTCAAQGEPFFCYLPTNVPHGPAFVAPEYAEPYKKPGVPANFFGMIANLDENMGKLLAMLDETGLADNTILIFMTDNGGTGGVKTFNAGMRDGKTSLYDGGHRVPCFIRWPAGKLREPGDVDELTTCQDLLPTLIDLCGLKTPSGARFDGTSLAGLLRGSQTALRDRMIVVQYHIEIPKWNATVMWKKWRLVKGEELYDIAADPGQKTNVAEKHPGHRQGHAGPLRALVGRGRADREGALLRSHRLGAGEPGATHLRRLVHGLRRQLRPPATERQLLLEPPRRAGRRLRVRAHPLAARGRRRPGCRR